MKISKKVLTNARAHFAKLLVSNRELKASIRSAEAVAFHAIALGLEFEDDETRKKHEAKTAEVSAELAALANAAPPDVSSEDRDLANRIVRAVHQAPAPATLAAFRRFLHDDVLAAWPTERVGYVTRMLWRVG